jgi:hypothetical protein
MRCPLCQSRPARRECPALLQHICPACCGTKRLTEIHCPDTCAYLANSRTHPAALVRRQQEQDLGALVPALHVLTEPQQQLLLLSVTLVDRFKGEGLDALQDRDVAEAAASLAATYETAAKGLIYDHRADSLPAQRLAREMRTVFEELGERRPSAFARDGAVVLRQLEHRVRDVMRVAGGDPRAFIGLAGRLARQFTQGGSEAAAPGEEAPPRSSLIIP